MTGERIQELLRFKTKDYSDCPVLTEDQLKQFKPRYASLVPVDPDVFEWLKQTSEDGGWQRKANLLLRDAMALNQSPTTCR